MAYHWSPDSWRSKRARQMPTYADRGALERTEHGLKSRLPLVSIAETRRLKSQLARVAAGEAYLLQGGDCAESFSECDAECLRATVATLMQMSAALTLGALAPVVKIGRLAGQFAKPRSEPTEVRDGVELPSYRGDIVNDAAFSQDARDADPSRMLAAYAQSASTLNLVRSLSQSALADFTRMGAGAWGAGRGDHDALSARLSETAAFMSAAGLIAGPGLQMTMSEIYSSHDAVLLNYEEAMTRFDADSGDWYDASAHMLWIGERTRDPAEAHVEYLRGVGNPVGLKCSATLGRDELLKLIDILNPANEPGRLTLIVRMGADAIEARLPALVRTVRSEGRAVVWASDPMHGNTVKLSNGMKTRPFEAVFAEASRFFDVLWSEGAHPGGLHLEMTGKDVTECTGGRRGVTEAMVPERYHTACDPRLNGSQALELAIGISEQIKAEREARMAATTYDSRLPLRSDPRVA
ncbi:3-deoxy-7-phosphoheptulonate synthase class II [Methylopila sp. Yamaguchi]|uniref:3-deoxy-7-phosphoheptulonate synthase class II n=1 Tax=Methylopila sp. Yamaguchi TaxID=1437817 RepID=UPI000CB3829F|nr:3-deoxy-7-phosphoheptulonate synthase class II [Methylopila sp. Yamaguchi]GBD48746.1 phospho-2-dehydro-3-deoxyheptonate aldolase [Methylopila sp. Yamaguchi]